MEVADRESEVSILTPRKKITRLGGGGVNPLPKIDARSEGLTGDRKLITGTIWGEIVSGSASLGSLKAESKRRRGTEKGEQKKKKKKRAVLRRGRGLARCGFKRKRGVKRASRR